jgi:serine/threonine protein kinase
MAKLVFETATNTYTSDRSIGDGGCGTVYHVTDSDDEEFALKLLRETTSVKRKRFKNELAFCRKNQHERIMKVLDEGILLDGSKRLPFYVMPLYELTLRKLMDTRIQHNNILPMFSDILDGVEAAHLLKVFHRDLKPENLLVAMPSRRVVVADFGVAHFEEEDLLTAVETREADRLANYKYSAPEQQARGRIVDERVDIYALGLILNEMFTGEIPRGTAYKTIASVSAEFAYLDAVVDRMIRQSPTDRPSSVAAIKSELLTSVAEFITRQKLDSVRNTVVQAASPSDSLGGMDVKAIGFKYVPGLLLFKLEPAPPPTWVQALLTLGTYRGYPTLAEPARVQMTPDGATVPANEKEAVEVAKMVQEWVSSANHEYRKHLQEEAAEEERRQRVHLAAYQRRLEEEARVMERLRKASLA